jgi:hypothetical protein
MVFTVLAALLFVQTFPLHMHGPHDHHPQTGQAGSADEHEHYAEIHTAASDETDAAHGAATKIDLSAAAVMKNLKFCDAPMAIFAFLAVLFLPLPINAHRWSMVLASPFTTRGIAFRPPLRAPPL